MKKFILTNAIILSSLLLYGCSDQQDSTQTNQQIKPEAVKENITQAPVNNPTQKTPQNNSSNPAFSHPAMPTDQASKQNNTLNSGIVEQILHSGGYTYVSVINNGKTFWLAGSQTPLKKGQEIFWGDYAVMKNFSSKSLNKTFDEILFVSGFATSKPTPEPAATATASVNSGKVISAQNSAGYSYIEVSTNGNTVWLAAPLTQLKAEDDITWSGASKMQNFTSKSLNKTFKEILFVGSVQVASNMKQ